MPSIKKKKSVEQQIEQAQAATERLRQQLHGKDDKNSFLHAPLSWWRERWRDKNIQRLFIENFITIRTKDPGDENSEGILTKLVFNDVQEDLHLKLAKKNAVLKSRKQGSSTYFLALDFATAVVLSGVTVENVIHDPDTEEKFRADLDIMYQNLPNHLKPKTKYYSTELIEFDDAVKGTINSRIKTSTVQPGREGKWRGQTPTRVHGSEVPHWLGNSKKAATSLLEAVAKGFVVFESTAYGIEYFQAVYQQGTEGKGGWKSFFYEWWWKPEYRHAGAKFVYVETRRSYVLLAPKQPITEIFRLLPSGASEGERAAWSNKFSTAKVTEEEIEIAEKVLAHLKKKGYVALTAKWTHRRVAEHIAWRRQKIEDMPEGETQFKVEYPENDKDCFEQTGRPLIKAEHLKVTCQPGTAELGRSYLIGCDVSLGLESGDNSAIEIIDLMTGRQVHSEVLKRPPDLLAYRLDELSGLYNSAVIVVERNNPGIATIRKLLELVEDERVYRHIDAKLSRQIEDGKLSMDEAFELAQHGIPTTGGTKNTGMKGLMGILLEQAIRNEDIGLSSDEWCNEARTVVWFENGGWGAQPGKRDDRVIALGLVNYVRVLTLGQFTGFVGVVPETGFSR